MKKISLYKNKIGNYSIVLQNNHKIINLYGIFDVFQKRLLLDSLSIYRDLNKGVYISPTVNILLRKYLLKKI